MAELNNNNKKTGAHLHQWLISLPRRSWAYLQHHFPSTLFVTACVTILHLGTSWLDAFDAYTYVWVGNFVSAVESSDSDAKKVAVVEIDKAAFDDPFLRRSPLKRGELLGVLEKIYAASPELVVIDLDLARAAPGLLDEDELQHEAGIARTIMREADKGVPTVLLARLSEALHDRKSPLQACRPDGELRECKGAAGAEVRFGHGDIPERFGAANWYFKDAASMFAAAQLAVNPGFDPEAETVLLARRRALIDPRTYFGQLEVVSISKSGEKFKDLASMICTGLDGGTKYKRCDGTYQKGGVVYLGGAFGGDDLFATPIGRLYGVELHAAAFASCWPLTECSNAAEVWHHLGALALDLVTGLLLGGLVITPLWKKYVAWRMDPDPKTQAVAGIAAFRLMCYLAIALALLVLFAGWMLASFNIWLSPIPIAVGMFIEAWVVGPIAQHESSAHLETASEHEATVVVKGRVPELFWITFTPTGLLWTKRCLLWLAAIAAGIMVLTVH